MSYSLINRLGENNFFNSITEKNYRFERNTRESICLSIKNALEKNDLLEVNECLKLFLKLLFEKENMEFQEEMTYIYHDDILLIHLNQPNIPFYLICEQIEILHEIFKENIYIDLILHDHRFSQIGFSPDDIGLLIEEFGDYIRSIELFSELENQDEKSFDYLFELIMSYCNYLLELKINLPKHSCHFLNQIDSFRFIEELTLENCLKIDKLPLLPKSLRTLNILNTPVKAFLNIPECLTNLYLKMDESHKMSSLNSLFAINVSKAVQLFPSFQCIDYQTVMELLFQTKGLSVVDYLKIQVLVFKQIIFKEDWVENYKAIIVERIYKIYTSSPFVENVDVQEKNSFKFCIHELMNHLEVLPTGQLRRGEGFDQIIDGTNEYLQNYMIRNVTDMEILISKYMRVYPYFLYHELKIEILKSENLKNFYSGLFLITIPTIHVIQDVYNRRRFTIPKKSYLEIEVIEKFFKATSFREFYRLMENQMKGILAYNKWIDHSSIKIKDDEIKYLLEECTKEI